MKEDIDNKFNKGIELRDSNQLIEAVEVFLNLIQTYPHDTKIAGTYTVLAGVYYDLDDFDNSLTYFQKATEIKPKYELASIGVYLSYVKLNNYEMAINELKRYLSEYPAIMYLETLKELLGDIKNGYALKYKTIIIELGKKNGLMDTDY